MSRMVDIVTRSKFSLMVSIPANDLRFALAAEQAGADAIKTHINLYHHASGSSFGTWDEEKKSLIEIINRCTIPFGLVPGAEKAPTQKEMLEIKDAGFDFWDLYFHHIPGWLFDFSGMGRMAAADPSYDDEKIKAIAPRGIQVIESSVFGKDTYGQPLTPKDIERVKSVAEAAGIPVLISTQRAIRPDQLKDLKSAGLKGIVIGAVVTGRTPEGVAEITGVFRDAIDRL